MVARAGSACCALVPANAQGLLRAQFGEGRSCASNEGGYVGQYVRQAAFGTRSDEAHVWATREQWGKLRGVQNGRVSRIGCLDCYHRKGRQTTPCRFSTLPIPAALSRILGFAGRTYSEEHSWWLSGAHSVGTPFGRHQPARVGLDGSFGKQPKLQLGRLEPLRVSLENGVVTGEAETSEHGTSSRPDLEESPSGPDARGALLNDAGPPSTSTEAKESVRQNVRFGGKGVWRRDGGTRPVAKGAGGRRKGGSKNILERHLETQTILSPEASSLLDELRTVDSDPERLAILEKCGAQLSDADLLELLRRQRGYRTARLFFEWMESQPGVRKGSPAPYHILIAFAHRSQKTDAIPDLASELEAKGIPLTSTTFCTLVEAYARSKQCEYAQLWFDKLRDAERMNKWSTVSSAYWAMMDMYEKVGKPSEAARVWRALVERGGVHTRAVYTYNRLLDGLGKQGLFEEAMEMVDEMRSRGVHPDTTTYNILINCYGKSGARHQAVKLFEEMQSAGIRANAVTYNTLVSVHVKAEDYPAAAAVMQLMRQAGERPSEFTLNAMITAYAKLGQAEEALEVYSKFREAGIAPSAYSYNSLIHLLVLAGKGDEGEAVLRDMQEGGAKVSDVTWNGLISAHNRVGNYAKVLECFERMKAAGFSPNQITFTPVVDALFKLQRDDEAMEMFDEMRSQGVQPLSMTYGVMLVVCSRNDMLGEASALLDEMRDRGVPPSDMHYITVVDGLVRTGRWEEAHRVYRAAREEGRAGAQLYACLVCGLEAQGQDKQAEELFQAMKAAGVDTAEVIYGSLIAALGRLGQYEDAMATFQELESSDVEPTARTYSQIVSVYGKAGLVGPAEAAFQVAERMGEASIRVHNALVDVYLRAGLYQEAEAWYKKMEEEGLEADEATCRTFLVRYAEAGLWQPASRWLNKTMSSNYLFEATTYNKVLRCFGSAKKIDLAWMLFHIMKAGIKATKPIPSTYNTMIGIMGEEGRYKDAAALVQEMRVEGVEITEITKAILRRIVWAANSSSQSVSAKREVDVAIDKAFGTGTGQISRRLTSVGSTYTEGEFVPSTRTGSTGRNDSGVGLPDYLRDLSKL